MFHQMPTTVIMANTNPTTNGMTNGATTPTTAWVELSRIPFALPLIRSRSLWNPEQAFRIAVNYEAVRTDDMPATQWLVSHRRNEQAWENIIRRMETMEGTVYSHSPSPSYLHNND